jgi:integrase
MPKLNLTQSQISKLACPSGKKRIEYCDTTIPGLFLEVRHTGNASYYLRYRSKQGKTRYQKLGIEIDLTLADARKQARKLRAEILLGRYPGADELDRECMSFGDFFREKYLPYVKPRKRSWKDDDKLFRSRLNDRFGSLSLLEIDLESTERFLGELAEEGLAAGSVRHFGQLLKRCLNLAVSWKLIDVSPLSDLKLQQVNDAREYFLSPDELQRLLYVLDTDEAHVPCLAAKALLFTGCRVGEMLKCRWRDLDLDSETPTLKVIQENSKSGRARYVPLSEAALKVINQLPSKGKSEYLFTNSRNGERLQSIDKAWQRLRKEADLHQLRLHDLRHNFASMLVNSGESLYTVQTILGHQDPALSARYSHLSGTALQDAANSVSGYLDKALNKKGSAG